MKNTTVPNVRGSNEDIKSIEAAAFTVASVLTLSFNSLVLATFYRGRNRREKNVNLFVINLMVCQEMIALLIMPFVVASTMSSVWMTNEVLCQINGFTTSACFYASVLTHCLISLDRFVAITMATKYRNLLTRKRSFALIVTVWTLAGLLSLPPLFGWSGYQYNLGTLHCSPRWLKECGYFAFTFVLAFFMPISATIISYAVIFWSVRRHRLRISIWHRLGAQSPKVPRQATDQRDDSNMTKSHRSNSDLQLMSDPGTTIINGSPLISPTLKTSQIRPWKIPWDTRSKGSLQAVGRINQTQIEITVQEIQVESNGPPDHSYREDPRNQEADQGNIDKFYSSRLSIKESKKLKSEESDSESCTDETSAAGTQENNTPDIRCNLVENNSSKKAKDMKAQSEGSIKILADGEEKQKYQKNGELFHLVETKVLETEIQKTSKPHSTRKEDFSHNKLTPVPVARAKKAQRSDSKKQIAREYQVAKTGCLLVIIFIICYGPYSIAHLCHKTYHVPLWAEHFSMWCVFLNGILSPVVYGIRNKAIRTEARNLLLCKR